jgi:PEGA domain
MSRRLGLTCVFAVALSVGAAAPASSAPPAPARARGAQAPAPAPPSPADAAKAEAREHFDKGVVLYRERAWDAALAEFQISRQLFPTRNATTDAAICLKNLQREDEALEMYETLLREFPDLSADVRVEAKRELDGLRGRVGTIDVQRSEPDAVIAIDGRERGEYPALAPLRVRAGSHTLRVYKQGYEPFETRVEVAGGQSVSVAARLRALQASGRLRVTESSGQALRVIVDGNVVGQAPWEGALPPGEHAVFLRGDGDLGTQPATVRVRRDELTSLALAAEPVPGSLRLEPTPAGALVSIDKVTVGHGIWQGRLRKGMHEVSVAAEGFRSETRRISLDRGDQKVIAIELPRDQSSPLWRRPPRFTLEAAVAAPLTPSFGGDVANDCATPCRKSVGAGASFVFRGGYELGSGFGFGVSAGYVWAQQQTMGRAVSLKPVGLQKDMGTVDDLLTLRGFLGGAFAALGFGDRFPIRARLGAGALIGSVGDLRTGTFSASDRSTFSVGPLGAAPFATFLYIDPEIRMGMRLGGHLEISFGVEALVFVALGRASWEAERPVNAAGDGLAHFSAERLTGAIVPLIAPGLGLRYEL